MQSQICLKSQVSYIVSQAWYCKSIWFSALGLFYRTPCGFGNRWRSWVTTLPLIASMTVFSQNTYTYNYINPIYRQNIPVLWSVSPPLETRKRDVRTPLRCVRLHRTAHTGSTQRPHKCVLRQASPVFTCHVSRYKDRNGGIMRQLTLPSTQFGG